MPGVRRSTATSCRARTGRRHPVRRRGDPHVHARPIDGSIELWRVAIADGSLERLTTGRHSISAFDQVDWSAGRSRTAWLRSSPTELSDLWVRDGHGGAPRRLTDLNRDLSPRSSCASRSSAGSTVDGRRIQGWFLAGRRQSPRHRPSKGVGRAAANGRRPARHPDPRRPAHPLRLGADARVPAPRRHREWASSSRTRAAPRATAATSTRRTSAIGARARCATSWPGIDALVADGLADPDRLGAHRRLVRRLPDELDPRPRRPVRRGDDLPLGERHGAPDADRRHCERLLVDVRVPDDALGRPGLLPRDLTDHVRRLRSGRRS